MKTTTKMALLVIAATLLSLAAYALTGYTQVTDKIQLKENGNCQLVTWQEEVPEFGNCTRSYIHTVCDDEPLNTSCREVNQSYAYTCKTGTQIIQRNREECREESMEVVINMEEKVERYVLNHGDWGACSKEVAGNGVIITCDSKWDSDRNGVCKPGESCVRFIITESGIWHQIKNSRENYAEVDDSFFVDVLEMEVAE